MFLYSERGEFLFGILCGCICFGFYKISKLYKDDFSIGFFFVFKKMSKIRIHDLLFYCRLKLKNVDENYKDRTYFAY